MTTLCAAIGHAYSTYYKQLPRIRVKGRHIDLISEHYAIEIINYQLPPTEVGGS